MAVILNNELLPEGLTPELRGIFDAVSRLDCIKGLYLCGGTAQSIQMNHRLSEDLDFELLGFRKERPSLDFQGIIDEVSSVFPDTRKEILGEDHFQLFVTGRMVKLSFYRPNNPVKYIHDGYRYHNLVAPSLQDLLGMKLYTICLRTRTRDFYDIYCLLEKGLSLSEGVSYASHLSRHSFKSRDMLSNLLLPQLYPVNDEFLKLKPRMEVTSLQMRERFQASIVNEMSNKVSSIHDLLDSPLVSPPGFVPKR